MYRLNLTIVLLVIVIGGAIGVTGLMSAQEQAAEARLAEQVSKTHLAYDQVKRLRDLQLKDFAAGLARSEIGVFLGAMADNRKAMLSVESDVYRAVPGPPKDESLQQTRQAFLNDNHGVFLDRFAERLHKNLAPFKRTHHKPAGETGTDAGAKAALRDSLVTCNAFGVNNCVYRFVSYGLSSVMSDITEHNPFGITPDLVIITDHRGTGLVDFKRPQWSDDSRFGAAHSIVLEVRKGEILRDVIKLSGTENYYFVTAAPIFEQGKFRGAVLVGVAIGKKLVDVESETLGRMVGYLDGKAIIRSNLPPKLASVIRHNLPSRTIPARITHLETPELVAEFVPVTGSLTNSQLHTVFVLEKAAVTADSAANRTVVWIVACIVLALSLLIIMLLHFSFKRPFVEIDAGIHEIINGNHDYSFKMDYREGMWRSMTNSLNMMVAGLTGRNIEEEARGGAWDESLMGENPEDK